MRYKAITYTYGTRYHIEDAVGANKAEAWRALNSADKSVMDVLSADEARELAAALENGNAVEWLRKNADLFLMDAALDYLYRCDTDVVTALRA